MSNKYPHLNDKTTILADKDVAERVAAIQAGMWITYERAKEILDRMEELFQHPPIDRMPHLLIVGPTNNGKTQILNHFLEKHPVNPNPDGDVSIVPVIKINAPPTPDFGELCTRILDSVNAPFRQTAKPADHLRTVKLILAPLGTRVLMIDDIQHMLSGGPSKQREFRNAIKDLGNELKISIIAAGIEDAYLVFATDPQLRNRFPHESLPEWKTNIAMGRLLSSIEQKLPLRKASNLKSAEILQKIAFMSEGTIGEIYAVVKMAAIKAIRDGSESISLELLNGLSWKKPSERKDRPTIA